jgi:hypothetical protein
MKKVQFLSLDGFVKIFTNLSSVYVLLKFLNLHLIHFEPHCG